MDVIGTTRDLGTPLRGEEEIELRRDVYRDRGGRATQEAKAEQQPRVVSGTKTEQLPRSSCTKLAVSHSKLTSKTAILM